MPQSEETCCVCDSDTGRAGASDDSIYKEVIKVIDPLFNGGEPVTKHIGETVGPLCEECYRDMEELGFFEAE